MTMKRKQVKAKKAAWFVKVRGSYLPRAWQGWVSYIPFVAFLVWAQIALEDSALSTSIAVLIYFSCLISSGLAMTWIAARKS
jgi:hypothetical protein